MRALPIILISSLAACGVDEQIHKKALDDLAARQSELEACRATAAKNDEDLKKQLEAEVAARTGETEARGKVETELASLKTSLQTTESELHELRTQRAAAEARLSAYRKLGERLKALVDTGKLNVGFRKGQMVLRLPSEILFPSGRSNLSKQGEAALAEVAKILSEFKDRRFMIAGHTDNQSINTARFPNNWHLSTARAVSVVEFFITQGFAPENLAPAGYGEFDPIGPNDTPEQRTANRRIEIILVPDLSELPSMVEEPAAMQN